MAGLRERNVAEIRRRIVEAADIEFAANGYAATKMEAVAERARVSVRTLYNHFPRKEMLYLHDVGFYIAILEAAHAAGPNVSILEAVIDHLKGNADKKALADDIGVRAFDMLLWDRLEQELAILIKARSPKRDDLSARSEAALITVVVKSSAGRNIPTHMRHPDWSAKNG